MKNASAIIGGILALAFGLYLGSIVRAALRSEIARVAGGREYKKRKEPVMYWITIAIQGLFCLGLVCLAVFRLTGIHE